VTPPERGTLLLIRHAESSWNALGRWQGWSDPGLSSRGREQAHQLARELAGAGIEAVVASDLRRARETAAIVAVALGLELAVDARLRERDLGSWSGLTTPEIAGRWPEALAQLRARDPELRPGGGESTREVQARLRSFLADLAARSGLQRVALVTHGGVIRALGAAAPVLNASCFASTLDALQRELGQAAPPADLERL
jgi:broad specificity phosphatase PhoE